MTTWTCPVCGAVSADQVTVTHDSPDGTEVHACGERAVFVGWPAWEDARHSILSVSVLAI